MDKYAMEMNDGSWNGTVTDYNRHIVIDFRALLARNPAAALTAAKAAVEALDARKDA